MNQPIEPRNPSTDRDALNEDTDPGDGVDTGAPYDDALARLLVADLSPHEDGEDSLDALVEPPAADEPLMTLERRRKLLAVVGTELARRRLDVGQLPQVLYQRRMDEGLSFEDLAARVNETISQLALTDLTLTEPTSPDEPTGRQDFSAVTAEDVERLETEKANFASEADQSLAAVLAAIHGLRPSAARDALRLTLDQPNAAPLAAARPVLAPLNDEDRERLSHFMTTYDRVRGKLETHHEG